MPTNQINGSILKGGLIKLTTDLISDPALHVEAEAFVKGVEKDSGGVFKVEAHKGGKVTASTHQHADGTIHQH